MRSLIIHLLDYLSNYKWNTLYYLKLIIDKNFMKAMLRNKGFQNIHAGKRCFIIGNGPSLSQLDLSKIRKEYKFTVNTIMYNALLYQTISSDYHVIIDPAYFCLNPEIKEDKATIELLKTINYKNKKPLCLTNYDACGAIHKYGLHEHLDFLYLYQHKILTPSFTGIIDLSKNMPTAQNVVQTAIYAAIYMGFRKIYLIGCDMSYIFITLETKENGERVISKNFHAYEYNSNEMKMIRKLVKDNEYRLQDYAKTFNIFKRIRKYALKKGITIKNATPGGFLDVFERVNYDTLFHHNTTQNGKGES